MDEKNPKIALLKYRAVLTSIIGSIFALILYYNTYHGVLGLSTESKRVIEAISLAIFTGFFVSVLFSIHSKLSILDFVKDATRESISEVLKTNRLMVSEGLQGIHKGMPYGIVNPLMESGNVLCILQTFIPDMPQIKSEIQHILEKGGCVKILLIDPESEMAAHRAFELGGKPSDYISYGVQNNLRDLSDIFKAKKYKNRLQIRLYKNIPSLCLYKIDDVIFIGFYTANKHAVEGVQLELNISSPHSEFFMNHFEAIWGKSTPYIFK